jgi:peptidoglycan/xylan/chitin deacetylase (PgdA/CDA1 family)
MPLLVLMYHRASAGRHGNPAEMLDAHFAVIARECHCVLPGEPLVSTRLNICLTFDDAYFDFYAVVFPLLSKHRLRALLAVPISLIGEKTDASRDIRLQGCARRQEDPGPLASYCTWPELAEMADSGRVSMASHGFTHTRLDRPGIDLHTEIVVPKTLLAGRTERTVDSLVLPYGRFDATTLACARQHYRFVFRIGSADNGDWSGNLIYRVDADEMASAASLFSRRRLASYRMRRHWNALRSR